LTLWHQFLWVIFPYLSLVTFVLGHIFRYRYDQYGWTPKSSQLLERRLLMWGVLLFHWGFLFVFGGHVRRWFIPRIRNNTDTIRFLTDALLLVVIGLGLAATIGYRVYASQYELHGEFEYRDSVGAWFRSLFLFRPDASLMVGAPLIFQLHTLSAFVLFALWPFSSLVHVFSVPLGYLRRSYVQYRSSNPQATLARERASKVTKKPAKAEQGSHIE
jgi:nitrate reductase gamma subunit